MFSGNFKKVLANVSRITGRDLLVICSRTCLKSFVICALPTHDVRNVRKIFVKPQTDSDSLENISRMSHESSEGRPIISRPINELFAFTSVDLLKCGFHGARE